jgi:signal-transduction protein with cAMP-binding, CBS, and nucleotidyltransferase domain
MAPLIWSVNGVFETYEPRHDRLHDPNVFKRILDRKLGSHNELNPAIPSETERSKPNKSPYQQSKPRHLMKLHGFRHVPIVSVTAELVGMISDRDLMKHGGDNLVQTAVDHIMTRKVLSATPETLIRDLAGVMLHEKISCLPILNEENLLNGLVTVTDILKSLWKRAPLEMWA